MPGEPTLRLAGAILSVLGIGVAAYITIAEAGGGSAVCVAGSGGCVEVSESEYSSIGGVNVSVLGAIGYLALLATAATPGDLGRAGGLLLALTGFGFSAYLTYLELLVIEAVCQWCVASAALMTALLVINATRALGYTGKPPGVGPKMSA